MADPISEIVETMERTKAVKRALKNSHCLTGAIAFALDNTVAFFLTMINHIKTKSPPEKLSASYAEVAETFVGLDMNVPEIKQARDNMTRVYELCKCTQSAAAPGGD